MLLCDQGQSLVLTIFKGSFPHGVRVSARCIHMYLRVPLDVLKLALYALAHQSLTSRLVCQVSSFTYYLIKSLTSRLVCQNIPITAVLQQLIAHRADVHAEDESHSTPLHLASSKGDDKAVQLLIDHGADVNAEDGSHKTPLHLASSLWNTKTVQLLIEHGADVNARDGSHKTPLHLALSNSFVGMPKFGSVRFSEVSRRTLNQNRTCGRQKGEPRTRTERTGFGRFGLGSTRVWTFELRKEKKKSFDWNTLLQDTCTK